MANKPFEIQSPDLIIGGVSLQAGTTGVVIPGVTQAANYFVEEVKDVDGVNPDTFGSDDNAISVIDNAEYLYRSGTETPSNLFSAAAYNIEGLDDGEIEEISVVEGLEGTFLSADKAFAEAGNMWATTVSNALDNFNAGDWIQIPFRPKMRAGVVENIGGSSGNKLVNGDWEATLSNGGVLRVDNADTEQNYFKLTSIQNENDTYGLMIDVDNQAGWTFLDNGNIQFPDGTIQTTAYTGGASTALYVAVINTGIIAGSTDGINWTEYNSSLDGISYVAVGPNKIVYVADSSVGSDDSLWYADTYDTAPTEVTSISTRNYRQIKYFQSISKFVAVGDNGASDPALVYSSDGVTWTEVTIDPTFLSGVVGYTGGNFTDIEQNNGGFFITSDRPELGGFYIANITDTLDGTTNVAVNLAVDKVLWASNGEFPGWHIFDDDTGTGWYYNSNTNPGTGSFSNTWGIANVGASFESIIGYNPGNAVETVIGNYNSVSTVMVSTDNGQILYWPAVPNGPFVSIPKPYTATITAWTSSATSQITISGRSADGTGERFTVTGSTVTAYNGTYYIGGPENDEVFTDIDRLIPFDTSALDPFTGTATITWSHGQYIDALHYSNGIFYAGNDDEELFSSTDGGATWTQVESLTGSPGEPDYLNDIDSYVTGGTISTGDITFSGVDIRGNGDMFTTGSINLVPNSTLKSAGQYITIYPTNQFDYPHVHIAAGDGGELYIGNDDQYVKTGIDGSIAISSYNADTDISHGWNFGIDGSTSFPILTVPISDNANPSGTGQTLKFNDPAQQAIIYGPPSTIDYNSAERVIIQGAPGYTGTTGEGGDVYLWAGPGGDAGGDGGDIKIRAGRGQLTGGGGYLNFQAGQSNTGNGGWINIESGSSNTFGQGGNITIDAHSGAQITLRTYNSEGNSRDLVLNNAGALVVPGAVVKSTVEKVGANINGNNVVFVVTAVDGLGAVTELTVTNSPNPAWVTGTSGLALTDIDFTVSFDGAGNASVVVNSSGNGHSVSETFYLQPNAVGAVAPTPTALDLTKSINKLTNNINDNDYTLADGVEGQIMYLVPTPNTVDPTDIRVLVNHARNGGTQSLNAYLCPFGFNTFTGSICTLIFTDSHWQQVGGNWV